MLQAAVTLDERSTFNFIPATLDLPLITQLIHSRAYSSFTMCGADIFLGVLAIFFPPIAGTSMPASRLCA